MLGSSLSACGSTPWLPQPATPRTKAPAIAPPLAFKKSRRVNLPFNRQLLLHSPKGLTLRSVYLTQRATVVISLCHLGSSWISLLRALSHSASDPIDDRSRREYNGNDDYDSPNDLLIEGRYPHKVHYVCDHGKQEGSGHGSAYAPDAAHQAGPTDDHCSDGIELQEGASRGLGRAQPSSRHPSSHRRTHTAYDVCHQDDARRFYPGETSRFPASPNSVYITAERRIAQHTPTDEREDSKDDQWSRHRANSSTSEEIKQKAH